MTDWTEQELQKASDLWKAGLSASTIGARIGRNRQVVCGMAHRNRDLFPSREKKPLGKSVFAKPSRSKAVAKTPAAPRPSRWDQPAISAVDGRKSTKVAATVKPERPDTDFKPRKPVKIGALDSTTCRWPLWSMEENPGADGLYCGDATAESSSYCSHHRRLGTGLGTESERRALKTLEKAA
jgi:hypothetical protein